MDRNTLIFLNAIGLSSNNSLRIFNYCLENSMELSDFINLEEDFFKGFMRKEPINKIKNKISSYGEILASVFQRAEKLEVKITTILDEDFPDSLRYIEDMPSLLYMRGRPLKEGDYISIVGSRKHTSYANYIINKFVDEMAPYDFIIVSGMAYGTDALSHKRAIENKLSTVAVLGNGIDIIYPKANNNLYFEILKEGTIISEYPFGMLATKYTFPHRNRIISGLSQATIIAEAMERSGSLITARLAAEQGREVLAVPGNINSLYSKGTNKLISDGARPLIDIRDILDIYPDIQKAKEIKKEDPPLSEDEKKVLDFLKAGVSDVNEICIKSNFDVFYINTILTKLELKSVIEKISMSEFRIL